MNFTLENLGLYCLQIAIVVAAGSLVPFAVRLKSPKQLLAYWHLLLGSCLALPLLQRWKTPPVLLLQNIPLHRTTTTSTNAIDAAVPTWQFPEIAVALLLVGALLRLLWLGAGFLKLRYYRRSARLLEPLPGEIRALRARLASDAQLLVSDRLTSPVTFGLFNPVVVVPATFHEFAIETQEALVCHELLHIIRRDWIVSIAEELVRCAFWFHPAVWWLLGRIQLVREQVVDAAVIEHTQQPERYVDALLVIAASKLQADLAPAPLFLRKHHLRQRVETIVQGASMSKRLLVLSSLAAFTALPLIIGLATWRFPLNAAPQQVMDAPGVEFMSGPWTILHRTGISYPRDAAGRNVSGVVVVSVTVNGKGEVTDAKVVSGPEELRKAALEAILQWHFSTGDWDLGNGVRKPAPPSFEMAIRFNGSNALPAPPPPPPPPSSAASTSGTVANIDVSALPQELQPRVLAVLPTLGASYSQNELWSYSQRLVQEVDSHLVLHSSMSGDRNVKLTARLSMANAPAVGVSGGIRGGVTDGVSGGISGEVSSSIGYAHLAPISGEARRIRVGGNAQANNLLQKVIPAYPPLAKQARIQGTVRFDATIGADGAIKELHLVAGHPLLVQSATEAASQWIYRPTLLNGKPVEVITQIDVNFLLSDSPPPAQQ